MTKKQEQELIKVDVLLTSGQLAVAAGKLEALLAEYVAINRTIPIAIEERLIKLKVLLDITA